MNIIFVRHGESTVNVAGVFTDRRDYPLTEKGRAQIQEAAAIIAQTYPLVGTIYASPFARTQESAGIVMDRLQNAGRSGLCGIILDERVREVPVGELEGKSGDAAQGFFDSIWTEWYLKGNFDYAIPGSETGHAIRERVAGFVSDVYEKHFRSGEDIAVLSHGGVMKCALPQIASLAPEKIREYWIRNADIVTLTVEGDVTNPDIGCSRYGELW